MAANDTEEYGADVDAEAGDYIEDDPAAWLAFVQAVRRYAERFDSVSKHLDSADGAAEVIAGAMLSYLAAEHSVFVRSNDLREAAIEVVAAMRARPDTDARDHPEGLTSTQVEKAWTLWDLRQMSAIDALEGALAASIPDEARGVVES